MSEVLLLPCPCCGSPAEIWEDCDIAEMQFYCVGCSHCTVRTDWLCKRDDVVSQWNARVESDEMPGWMRDSINAKRRMLDKHIGNEYVKNTFEIGNDAALEWVLSLRKPESKQ